MNPCYFPEKLLDLCIFVQISILAEYMIIVAIPLLSLSLSPRLVSSLTLLQNLIRPSSFSAPHSAWHFLTSIYLLDILVLGSNRLNRLKFFLLLVFPFFGCASLGYVGLLRVMLREECLKCILIHSTTLKNNRSTIAEICS